METVFITVHDLSLDARIRYCSDSIEDLLGYLPHEVKGTSCWKYFHPDEIHFARAVLSRSIHLDRAAVLNYCRIKHKNGSWVRCECVFTVVYDVLVASTSIYRQGPKARQRAIEGAGVRRIFSSSPRHRMLSFLSDKFCQEPQSHSREPRAALFLNRFTRTLTIMFATRGVTNIFGLHPEQLVGKSFYYCIAENCLQDAVKCLESAKANDSIAYLRFWYRDPLKDDGRAHSESMPDAEDSGEDEDGSVPFQPGLHLSSSMSAANDATSSHADGRRSPELAGRSAPQLGSGCRGRSRSRDVPQVEGSRGPRRNGQPRGVAPNQQTQQSSLGNQSTDLDSDANDAIFERPALHKSSTLQENLQSTPLEIEAVVSCTSDGLVVVLRRARPLVPHALGVVETSNYANGLFASPWAPEPVMPSPSQETAVPLSNRLSAMSEAAETGFMITIRDVAVFAWSLADINGSLTQSSPGQPSGEDLHPDSLSIKHLNTHGDSKNR